MTGCGRRRKCLVFVAGGMFVPWPKRAFLRRIFGSRLVLTANCTFSPICRPPVEPGDFSCLFGGKKALACGYPRTGALSAIRSNSRHIAANRSTPVCCAPQGRIPTKTQPFSPKPGYVPAAVSFFRTAQQEKLEKLMTQLQPEADKANNQPQGENEDEKNKVKPKQFGSLMA